MIQGSNLSKGKRFITSPKYPDCLCGPHPASYSVTTGRFSPPLVHFHLVPRLRSGGAILWFPHVYLDSMYRDYLVFTSRGDTSILQNMFSIWRVLMSCTLSCLISTDETSLYEIANIVYFYEFSMCVTVMIMDHHDDEEILNVWLFLHSVSPYFRSRLHLILLIKLEHPLTQMTGCVTILYLWPDVTIIPALYSWSSGFRSSFRDQLFWVMISVVGKDKVPLLKRECAMFGGW